MRRIFVVLTFLLIFTQLVLARGIGTTMFQILQMPTSAYDAALANTTSAGEDSAITNPAIIPFLPRTIILSHSVYLQDTSYSVGDVNLPLSETSGINFSFCYFDMGSMTKTIKSSTQYSEIGSFNANDKVCSLSYGARIYNKFYSGVSIKYINQTIDDVSYSGFSATLTGVYFVRNETFITFGIKDFGPDVKGYSLPTSVSLGISSELTNTLLGIFQVDNYYNDDFVEFKFATEKSFGDIFCVRAGYILPNKKYGGTNNNFITNLTLGAGLKFKGFFVDYAWLPKEDLGNVHMFTIRANF